MIVAIDLTSFKYAPYEKTWIESLLHRYGQYAETRPEAASLLLLTSPTNHDYFRLFETNRIRRLCMQPGMSRHRSLLVRAVTSVLPRRFFPFRWRANPLRSRDVSALLTYAPSAAYAEPGVPVVAIAQGMAHGLHPYYYGPEELSERSQRWDLLKSYNPLFLCTTAYARQHAIAHMGVPEARTALISFEGAIIDSHHSEEQDSAVIRTHCLDKRKYFLYPADILPEKNHRVLLMAYGMFRKKHPEHDAALVLAGRRGDPALPLEDALKKMGLDHDVVVLGELSEDQLGSVIRRAHTMLLPSLYEDSPFRLNLIKTGGRPLLASKSGCIPEVVGDGARYFDPRKPDELVECMHSSFEEQHSSGGLPVSGRPPEDHASFERAFDEFLDVIRREERLSPDHETYTVTGIYDDGWAGAAVRISFCKSRKKRLFSMQVNLPGAQPRDMIKMLVRTGWLHSKKYQIKKGAVLQVHEAMPHSRGFIHIRFSNGFTPEGADTRLLTAAIEKLRIIDTETGEAIHDLIK